MQYAAASSRRQFLTTLAGAATLLRPYPLRAAEPDPRLTQVLARTIAVDMHSHVGIPSARPTQLCLLSISAVR